MLTPGLNGIQEVDRSEFPGIEEYHPWHGQRVVEWKKAARILWNKTASGYKDGTDAGIASNNVSLLIPNAAESAAWSWRQWAEWNENRQAAGLSRVHIYQRKSDGAMLTEFQVHQMFGTPFVPKNLPDHFMSIEDKWKAKGYWHSSRTTWSC